MTDRDYMHLGFNIIRARRELNCTLDGLAFIKKNYPRISVDVSARLDVVVRELLRVSEELEKQISACV